jgi:hypothetical protein
VQAPALTVVVDRAALHTSAYPVIILDEHQDASHAATGWFTPGGLCHTNDGALPFDGYDGA